jgi:hypothetical protein
MLTNYANGQQKTRLFARLQAATVTNLSIPREDRVQEITVWRYVFTLATHNLGSLRSSDLPGIDDHGTD